MSDDQVPIWLRPEPSARRPRFTREKIAATALAIADAEGFEAVSMRRVAAELGAGTMTLYHYVRTKDELVALMDDALMGEVVVPDGELPVGDWRAALGLIARRSHDAFVRHPWALEGLRGAPFGPNGMLHFDQSLAAVEPIALPPEERIQLISIVDDYVFGYILRQAGDGPERSTGDGDDGVDAVQAFVDAQLAGGHYPHLARLLGDGDRHATWDRVAARWGERFEHGLTCVLDGIAVGLERRGLLPPAPAPAGADACAGAADAPA